MCRVEIEVPPGTDGSTVVNGELVFSIPTLECLEGSKMKRKKIFFFFVWRQISETIFFRIKKRRDRFCILHRFYEKQKKSQKL